MKEIFVLVHDGLRGLFLDDQSGLSVMKYSHWPVYKRPSRTNWPCSLANHVTYGLLGPCKSVKMPRPFGLPVKSKFYSIQIEPEKLDTLSDRCKTVWRWHHHYGPFDGPFKVKLADLDTDIDKFDLMSAHCIRSLD